MGRSARNPGGGKKGDEEKRGWVHMIKLRSTSFVPCYVRGRSGRKRTYPLSPSWGNYTAGITVAPEPNVDPGVIGAAKLGAGGARESSTGMAHVLAHELGHYLMVSGRIFSVDHSDKDWNLMLGEG